MDLIFVQPIRLFQVCRFCILNPRKIIINERVFRQYKIQIPMA